MTELDLGLRHDDGHGDGPGGRRGRGSRVGLLLGVLVVLAGLLAGLGLGGRALVHNLTATPDWTGGGTGAVVVQVKDGQSLSAVGATLRDKGVVESVAAFTKAASRDDRARQLQPGFYRVREHMSGAAALALMLDPKARASSQLTVPEGSTLAQILALAAGHSKLTVADLTRAARDGKALGLPAWAGGKAQGLLFPATYEVDPGSSAVSLLAAMVDRFQSEAATVGLAPGAKALKLTPYQVLTVASILEKEAKLPGDFPKVARVLYNRLAKGMPLQVDSTLEFVLPQRKGHLSNSDIKIASPYNTYLHRGLPPTPIDSPGEVALKAALHPADGSWLYFITVDKSGRTAFTDSYQEFLRLKVQAQAAGVY